MVVQPLEEGGVGAGGERVGEGLVEGDAGLGAVVLVSFLLISERGGIEECNEVIEEDEGKGVGDVEEGRE